MVRFSVPWKTRRTMCRCRLHRSLSKNYLKLGNNGIGYRIRAGLGIGLGVSGLFAPRYFRSSERKFPVGTFTIRGAKIPGSEKSLNRVRVVHNCTVYAGLLSLRYRTATYNTNSYDKLSYSCKIRNAVVPFRSGNYTITIKAGTLHVPFRRLSYSCKIRNETQSFRSGNYNDPTQRQNVDAEIFVSDTLGRQT